MERLKTVQHEQRRSVGTSSRKVDTGSKLRGEATYLSDVDDDELLHGAVVRSTHTHARIVDVDVSEAMAIDGVTTVVPRTAFAGQYDDVVRHYGDAVAAVAAETAETARQAIDAVEVEFEPLDSVHDPHEALSAEAPMVQPEDPVGLRLHKPHPFEVENDEYEQNVDDYHLYEVGDVEDGLAEADFVYEDTYRTPRVNHCNLDTHSCIAEWENDHLTITETIASPFPARETIAGFLGLEPDQVTVNLPPTTSSSFGGQALPKLSLEPVAATLSMETGRPVKLWFDRQEDFVATETRHPVTYRIRMGVTDDGSITAIDMSAVADTGAYPNGVGHIVLGNSEERVQEIYRTPNYRFEGVSVFTNNVVAGEYRGIGSTQMGYALESHVDELCRKAGFDPVAFRRRNFVEEGDQPDHLDQPIDSCGVETCLDDALEAFDELRSPEPDDPETLYGWGLASATHTTGAVKGGPDSAEVKLSLAADGTATITATAIDQGQGSNTMLSQVVSHETGIPLDALTVTTPSSDDDLEPDLGSIASRTTWIVGSAAKDAAETLVEAIAERADGSVDAIEDDRILLESGTSVPLTDVVDERLTVSGRSESTKRPPGYGVHVAEVLVDRETGHVDVTAYAAAQDVGYAINPSLVEGQIEGAVLHGLEFALFSELQLDDGNPINANLADYPAISPHEMPDRMRCELVESNEDSGPYGAKGVGTPSTPPVAPAVVNAIRDATGHRFTDLPIGQETIFTRLAAEEGDDR